jgi:hypothetical protein
VEGYRSVRSETLRRFRETKVPWQATHLCYISAVEAATPEEAEAFLKLAEFGVSATPSNPRVRGAMNYRAGRCEAAIHDLNLSAPVFPRRAWDWHFLAMAHQQLGHTEEARKNLKQAVEWIGQAERTSATEANSPWVNRASRLRSSISGARRGHSSVEGRAVNTAVPRPRFAASRPRRSRPARPRADDRASPFGRTWRRSRSDKQRL